MRALAQEATAAGTDRGRDNRRGNATRLLVVAVFAIIMLVACGGSSGTSDSHASSGGGMTVRAKVLKGQNNATAVFVPVSINGQGPFLFAIDTGSSKTVVDTALASRLGLPDLGPVPGGITGVASSTSAIKTRLSHWKLGTHQLAADTAVAIQLPQHKAGGGLDGLLGSDELSKYKTVTIDYAGQTVTFK
jgi:hypothetical protein